MSDFLADRDHTRYLAGSASTLARTIAMTPDVAGQPLTPATTKSVAVPFTP